MSTMEKLARVYAIDNRLRGERAAAASLMDDSEVAKVLEFLGELDSLAGEYQFRPLDIVRLISPDYAIPECVVDMLAGDSAAKSGGATKGLSDGEEGRPGQGGRKAPRTSKRYKNPHTGETIETRSANHKILKQWKAEHGGDVVEGWCI